jgi:hypothetical protein
VKKARNHSKKLALENRAGYCELDMFAACKKSPETSILLSLVTWFISKEDKYKAATYLVVIRDTIHSTRFELHEDVVVILE